MQSIKRCCAFWLFWVFLVSAPFAEAGGPPQNWTARSTGSQQDLYGIAFGNGTYIAVGAGGTILKSADAVTWSTSNSGTTRTLKGIAYSAASHLFVAVGYGGTIIYSDDYGVTWTANNYSSSVDFMAVAVGAVKNGGVKFVAVGSSGAIATANSPVLPWSAESLPSGVPHSGNLLSIASSGETNNANPLFVVVGANGMIFSSSDTKNWSALPCNFSGAVSAVAHQVGQNFVATGELYGSTGLTEKLLMVSGAACSAQAAATNATFAGMAYGDGYEVAVGYRKIMYSKQNSLTDWFVVTQPVTASLSGVTYGSGSFVAVGAQGAVYQSVAQQITGYQGCFTDDDARALPIQLMTTGATIETCIAAAQAKNYAYAGLQWRQSCFAGNTLGYAKVSDSECNTPCTANTAQICGGSWRSSIYATGRTPPPAPAPQYQGCYTDDPNRALPVQLMAGGATIENCTAAARARNLQFAGLQYGGQCFAGNSAGYAKTAEAQCNTLCAANTAQTCGGPWRNSVYATGVVPAPMPPATAYKGCYSDTDNRALPAALMSSGATIASCVAAAKANGYAFAGVQFGGQCYAGSTLGYTKVADSQCNTPCAADKSQICGGGWRNSIYSAQ